MQIKEIMNHPVITCPVQSTMEHAARLMWEFDCGIIPIVDDDGRLAGVVTDRDICMAAYTQGKPLADIPTSSAMARQVVVCHGADTIETAEELMKATRVRRLPIVDADGRPIGLVSMNDLARLVARAKKAAADRELVRTLSAICEPRPRAAVVAPLAS